MSDIRVTNVKGRTLNIAPDFPDGANMTGVCTATTFVGALTGNVTGTATGLAGSPQVTVGVSTFSGDVTFTGDAANVTWDKSTDDLKFADGAKAIFGTGGDMQISHDGTDSRIASDTGDLILGAGNGTSVKLQPEGGEDGLTVTHNGAVEAYYDNSKKLETTSSGITVTGTVTDDKGDVRLVPQNHQTSAYILAATDSGKLITITTGGITVDASIMSQGDMVTIVNHSGSDQTITQGSGVSMYNTADASTGNRTLAGRGMATLWFLNDAYAYISGSGLS